MANSKEALTIEEVAALTQWSESTVRRIEATALAKLRDGCKANGISHDQMLRYLDEVLTGFDE